MERGVLLTGEVSILLDRLLVSFLLSRVGASVSYWEEIRWFGVCDVALLGIDCKLMIEAEHFSLTKRDFFFLSFL